MENREKKPKGCLTAFIVLLVILLIIGGAAGFLYYRTVKAPLELDDPKAMAAEKPLSVEERFLVSAENREVQIRVVAEDFWYLILKYAGEDFLDMINAEVSPYGLTVSGCAIRMDEEGLRLDLELLYKETRLVAQVPCALEISGRHFSLKPAGVKVGVIPLPVEGLLSSFKLEYDLDLPVISEVTRTQFVQDAILLTGHVEQDIRSLTPGEEVLRQTAVFSEEREALAIALENQEVFQALLSHLEQEPGSLEELYYNLFLLADPQITQSYLDSRLGLTQRVFPGIDFSGLEARRAAMMEELTSRNKLLEQFFTEVVNNYNEKKFQLSEGQFLRSGNAFHPSQYGNGNYEELFRLLNPDDFYLVLVDMPDGHIRKTSSFYRMADENQEFTQEVDFNKTYILGCMFRSVTGKPFLLYESEIETGNTYSRKIKIQPLTEEDVAALQVPGKFGVWTGS